MLKTIRWTQLLPPDNSYVLFSDEFYRIQEFLDKKVPIKNVPNEPEEMAKMLVSRLDFAANKKVISAKEYSSSMAELRKAAETISKLPGGKVPQSILEEDCGSPDCQLHRRYKLEQERDLLNFKTKPSYQTLTLPGRELSFSLN
jgi:hypothetical protein